MEDALRKAIRRQSKKLIERNKRHKFARLRHKRRFKLRTGEEPKAGRTDDPELWKLHPHFDPYYCLKHSSFLAKTIWRKIIERNYDVQPAVQFKIPKDSGGHREIMTFSIPDAATANLFNRKLRDRNKNLQSPFCYSYRKDRTIFDAVLQLSSLIQGDKVYVSQYDFSKYFDSIRHEYLDFILNMDDFFVSPAEKFVIQKFVKHRFATIQEYKSKNFSGRSAGVPQGCSLSLFLSNIAEHELDKKLEKQNGSFVRFADDIVSITHEYIDAHNVSKAFQGHCYYSGISINYEKSHGIALLNMGRKDLIRDYFIDENDIGKINIIEEFDYLGHKFSNRGVQISSRGISNIKKRLARIIYLHLLHNLQRDKFNNDRIGPLFHDWDLVTCINEIRLYIYGGLKEEKLKNFIEQNKRIARFKGLMSFYPLVSTVDQFSALDGWLVSVLRRALKRRSNLIKKKFGITHVPLTEEKIIDGTWYEFQSGINLETGAPSFVLAWRAARKAFKQYGLADFEEPKYYSSVFSFYSKLTN